MVGMNPTANTRRAQRKERRRRERTDRWQKAAAAAKWTDPNAEPPASAWGRWTPPKRWMQHHAAVMRFTRGQIAYIADLVGRSFAALSSKIVTIVRMDGPQGGEP